MSRFYSLLLVGLLVVLSACPAHAGASLTTKLKNNFEVTGTLKVGGASQLVGAVTLPAGSVTSANIATGAVKREMLTVTLSPSTGACADATVYRGFVFPGRAGIVTKVTLGCQTAPTVGADVIKVLKAATGGNTMLGAATFDANTLVAATAASPALTATAADLALTATQGVYCEYSAGTQTVDAIGITATIEFEPTDF